MKEYKFTKKLPKESTSFRLAPEAKRQLEKEAKEYELTLSDYIARLVVVVRAENRQYKEALKLSSQNYKSYKRRLAQRESVLKKQKKLIENLEQEIEKSKLNSIDLRNVHQTTKNAIQKLEEKYPNYTRKQIIEACIIKPIENEGNIINELFDKPKGILEKYFKE